MASQDQEYNLKFFKENGFVRKRCEKCGSHFWTRNTERSTCGDAPCEFYSFIGNPIFKEQNVEEVREAFLSFFEHCPHKHTRLKRYPVVARWRDDIYLNIASIANFQPFVTSGKVPPPANPLVISQPCIRLEDLESIGKTGRHLTAFEMMGHHAFNSRSHSRSRSEEIYWKEETVRYCDDFLQQLGVPKESVTYKEAPWVGGGNAGPCLEVLTNGLELATLVFMNLKLAPLHTPRGEGEINLKGQSYEKMDTYIVDTGYGLERFVWASKGTPTVYDAVFPEVVAELTNAAGIEHPLETHPEVVLQNARLCGALGRRERAERLGVSPEEFSKILAPIETVYAVADHAKCLAFMLADGVVPSNAKEGYLARLVLRRAFRMLKLLGIETEMPLEEVVLLQIKTLKNSFPELENFVERIFEIVPLEKRRFDETLLKGERIVKQLTRVEQEGKREIPLEKLINLYDTQGLPPEFVKEVVSEMKNGGGVKVEVPEDFYSLVARMHSEEERKGKDEEEAEPVAERLRERERERERETERETETEKTERETETEKTERETERREALPKTAKLFYEKPSATEFEATVLDAFGDFVVLDRTLFYPEGGGQPADTGFLTLTLKDRTLKDRRFRVLDVQEAEGVVLHKIGEGGASETSKGAAVLGRVDAERRAAHTRHHSATHIVVWAARKVLGGHVWQAGAQKGEKRARIDITHFKRISDAERREIEVLANRLVMENKEIKASFLERNEAEQKYGFQIYQGGVPPGERIRIVRISADGGKEKEDEDVQACAGTHCSRTGEVGPIKILRTERIQDGIARIEFSAGAAAVEEVQALEELVRKSASVLKVPSEKLPATVERFFEDWKRLKKENERLRAEIADLELERLKGRVREVCGVKVVAEVLPGADAKELLKIASQLSASEDGGFVTILVGSSGGRASVVSSVPAGLKEKVNASVLVNRVCGVLGGGGGGTATLAQGGGERVEKAEEAIFTGLQTTRESLKCLK
ncbi:MAG: alanine--tRNA ligase [Candidatus Methanospirareceae archaeon]